jgi:PAS domain S-box-containing protein
MLAAPYGFIIKPVEARELRSTIELALHRHADDRKVREREARYRTIVESSPDAILLTDTDGKLMECNPQAAELFGVATPAGMIGRCLFDLLLPDDRDRARAAHRSVAPNGSRQWADYEFLREDGGRFPGEMSARPAFDTTHPPQGVIVIVRDITQRRRTEGTLRDALNRKDILLKEVNHRVHNHLSMLSRLLNLQARDIEDARAADLLRESRNRLKSIELMHSQILQSADLSAISMREYIRRLAALLYRSYGTHASTVSLTVDVDHICIGPDKALPCGIIINELLTNALRHAFPGKRKGEVNVRLHPNRGGTIQLEVRDNGIGIPNRAMLDRADTFGMTIIRLLTEQLHGTISVDRHEGTIFTVTIPV